MKIVKAKWLDAATRNDVAVDIREAMDEPLVVAETIGYLLFKDKERTIISSFIFPAQKEIDRITGYKTIHIIPTGAIIKIKELKEV